MRCVIWSPLQAEGCCFRPLCLSVITPSSLKEGRWKLNLLDDVDPFGWVPTDFSHHPGAAKWTEEAKRTY